MIIILYSNANYCQQFCYYKNNLSLSIEGGGHKRPLKMVKRGVGGERRWFLPDFIKTSVPYQKIKTGKETLTHS